MNQVEIGKFIAKERKTKKYTQKQLSEILTISDKTVSKWECGKGFPEVSLLLPLCNELDITVNELLSAKRLSDDSYKQKAEENIMSLIKEKEENQKKWKSMIVTGAISIISFLTLTTIVALYADTISLFAKLIIMVIAIGILIVGSYSTMQNERTIGYYKCTTCNKLFVPTMKEYIFSVHKLSTIKLKYPHCDTKEYCEKVMSKDK
ncbi:MAG: helix-turn-helix transcriptional regulator [Bacillota bacterium]